MKVRLAFALTLAITGVASVRSQTTDGRSVELILDASGSMKATLPGGQSRIDAAKDAVEKLVSGLPGSMRLALRAYGHQSPTSAKNCKDIQLLSGFRPVEQGRAEIVAIARGLKAQGYTPITLALELAANNLKTESAAGSRMVILVSDGKETCAGDPCAVAKALAAADARLVVHTIGFAVDVAARYQLQCIARVARGAYYEADTLGKLSEGLAAAIRTGAVKSPPGKSTPTKKPGGIKLANPSASQHEVIDVATGEVVTKLSSVGAFAPLKAGFYNVRFGNQLWRSIEVRDGETSEITTAIVEVQLASFVGHEVRDWETGELIEKLGSFRASMNLMPSSYTISFGTLAVPVVLEPGKRTLVSAGYVGFKGLSLKAATVRTEGGAAVIEVSSMRSGATLPPGKYLLETETRKIPFELAAGQKLELEAK